MLPKAATGRQHFFPPNSGYPGNQSLRASPVPGMLIKVETPKACVSFFLLTLDPPTHPVPATQLCRGSCPQAGTLKEEAGGGNPPPGRTEPRDPGWLCCRRDAWVWRPWAQAEGNRKASSGGAHCGHSLPSALRPVPPGDPSLLRPQGCDTSPGPQGLRGRERFFSLSLFSLPSLFSVGIYR